MIMSTVMKASNEKNKGDCSRLGDDRHDNGGDVVVHDNICD